MVQTGDRFFNPKLILGQGKITKFKQGTHEKRSEIVNLNGG